jgi:SAM-dependent methyltransferase
MVDFGRTHDDYARYRAGFPPALFQRLEQRGVAAPAMRALDLGAGTGTLALGLARRGLHVTALDVAAPMLAEARRQAEAQRLELGFVEARAERTGLPDGSFDLVTAGQCWHWFERPAAARECRRLLAPGGHLVIAHLDWLEVPGGVVELTLRALAEHGTGFPVVSAAGSEGMYPGWTREVRGAGFEGLETFSFDLDLPYSAEAWRGRIRASAAVGAVLTPDAVARFDADLARRLAGQPEVMALPHRVWALVARAP